MHILYCFLIPVKMILMLYCLPVFSEISIFFFKLISGLILWRYLTLEVFTLLVVKINHNPKYLDIGEIVFLKPEKRSACKEFSEVDH